MLLQRVLEQPRREIGCRDTPLAPRAGYVERRAPALSARWAGRTPGRRGRCFPRSCPGSVPPGLPPFPPPLPIAARAPSPSRTTRSPRTSSAPRWTGRRRRRQCPFNASIRPMSTSTVGAAIRSFISGIRLCPPASTLAPSLLASNSTASETELARWYVVCDGYIPSLRSARRRSPARPSPALAACRYG